MFNLRVVVKAGICVGKIYPPRIIKGIVSGGAATT